MLDKLVLRFLLSVPYHFALSFCPSSIRLPSTHVRQFHHRHSITRSLVSWSTFYLQDNNGILIVSHLQQRRFVCCELSVFWLSLGNYFSETLIMDRMVLELKLSDGEFGNYRRNTFNRCVSIAKNIYGISDLRQNVILTSKSVESRIAVARYVLLGETRKRGEWKLPCYCRCNSSPVRLTCGQWNWTE